MTNLKEQIDNFLMKHKAFEEPLNKIIDTFLLFTLTVSGADLMSKMGLKQGPELGKEIQRLESDNFKKLYLDIFIF